MVVASAILGCVHSGDGTVGRFFHRVAIGAFALEQHIAGDGEEDDQDEGGQGQGGDQTIHGVENLVSVATWTGQATACGPGSFPGATR